ncbi:3',5'-cyclic-nucleotide phosphodiesterase pde1 [Tulasnella sp. 408]|nr:3',5'-cyclic-nucleotide phosphodiesterase pde1 [Tulasnella sp. 408]
MPDFVMVVVGCGGGPTEDDLSAGLNKVPSTDTLSNAMERGGLRALWGSKPVRSGLGALTRMIGNDPKLFNDDDVQCSKTLLSSPAAGLSERATEVYSGIRSFIITHGHLDHVMSLVVAAGSQGGPTKYIYGLERTIQTMEMLFNGHIWPKLAARVGELAPTFFYRYLPVAPAEKYLQVAPNISVRAFPISHGSNDQSADGTYESSAWFLRNDQSAHEFLFFGDVEPDSISLHPRTRAVWKHAARKIRRKQLHTIFLECSWRNGRKDKELYGHLSPPHVLDEMRNLATEVVLAAREQPPPPSRFSFLWNLLGYGTPQPEVTLTSRELQGALQGVRLVVIHCKTTSETLPDGKSIADIISGEIRELVKGSGLGLEVMAAKQGMTIGHVFCINCISQLRKIACPTCNWVPIIPQPNNLACVTRLYPERGEDEATRLKQDNKKLQAAVKSLELSVKSVEENLRDKVKECEKLKSDLKKLKGEQTRSARTT